MFYDISYAGEIYYGVLIRDGVAIFQDDTQVNIKHIDILNESKVLIPKYYF